MHVLADQGNIQFEIRFYVYNIILSFLLALFTHMMAQKDLC